MLPCRSNMRLVGPMQMSLINVQKYPTIQPHKCPRKLADGTKTETKAAMTSGLIQVGILYDKILWRVLRAR